MSNCECAMDSDLLSLFCAYLSPPCMVSMLSVCSSMSSAILHLRELSLDDALVCLRCAVVYPGARDHPLMTCLYCSRDDVLFCPANAPISSYEYFITPRKWFCDMCNEPIDLRHRRTILDDGQIKRLHPTCWVYLGCADYGYSTSHSSEDPELYLKQMSSDEDEPRDHPRPYLGSSYESSFVPCLNSLLDV